MPAEAIVSELMRLLQSALSGVDEATLSEMECEAVEFGRRAARLVLGCMLEGQRDEPVVVKCECGGTARAKDTRDRVQVTLAGTHSIRRMRYRCEDCGEWLYPRDKHLGIGSSNYSSGVVALASEVAAGFPFGPCEEFLSRRFGLDLCYKQVQRLAERTGSILADAEDRAAKAAVKPDCEMDSEESPDVLTISADGLMVHCDGNWSEMKIGTFLSEYGRSSIATMDRCDDFGNYLHLEALRRGATNADKIVFVADGAAWIWNLASEHFPGAVEVVDWYHATEHLWEIANSWYGIGSDKARNWVKANKARLMEDGVSRVIASIRQWKPVAEEQVEVRRENLHYFSTNAHRMLYATFRACGYYIGSGSVESACKQYGHGRLKQAGMRWKAAGIEAVAHLRSALLNCRTDTILEAARIAA
jgi:hypothetical protein